jgi:hypothetical protein
MNTMSLRLDEALSLEIGDALTSIAKVVSKAILPSGMIGGSEGLLYCSRKVPEGSAAASGYGLLSCCPTHCGSWKPAKLPVCPKYERKPQSP